MEQARYLYFTLEKRAPLTARGYFYKISQYRTDRILIKPVNAKCQVVWLT